MWIRIFTAAAVLSADTFAAGMVCGAKGIKFSAGGMFAFAATGLMGLAAAAVFGSGLAVFAAGRVICGLVLVCAGVIAVLKQFVPVDIGFLPDLMLLPEKSDSNQNRKIEFKEAFFMAFALSADGFAACAGSAGEDGVMLPLLIFVFQLLFLLGGMAAGKRCMPSDGGKLCGVGVGVLLFIIGIKAVF